jgi:hypothetical protein
MVPNKLSEAQKKLYEQIAQNEDKINQNFGE